MADKTSANIIYFDTNGKQSSKAVTNVNPAANDTELKVFCNTLFGLTNNTVASVEKIERTNLTISSTDPLFVVTPNKIEKLSDLSMGGSMQFKMSYRGAQRTVTASGKKPHDSSISFNQATKILTIDGDSMGFYNNGAVEGILILNLPAGDGYDAATAEIKMYASAANAFTDI